MVRERKKLGTVIKIKTMKPKKIIFSVVIVLGVMFGLTAYSQHYITELYNKSLDAQLTLAEINVHTTAKQEQLDRYTIIAGEATGYAPQDNISGICADSNPDVTSVGAVPGKEVIAVDPDVIPYGSKVQAIGKDFYREGYALDTGGAMRQGKYLVDLWFETNEEANNFGRNDVIIVWKGRY